ncbi:endonuclease domain-containing protein [Paludisphaera soli]|uniref:endonuclease domain-containing protein n=1 Tax=Paludisphaera soli TaxID=2712865 RepID=UPI0013EB213F|nr:DUF559 domain-containing protein [Paludisphaera soli]
MASRSGVELGLPPLPAIGRARAAFVARGGVGAVLGALEGDAVGDSRLVAIRYGRLPRLGSLIDDVLERLADLALATWPGWCEHPADRGVSAPWRKAAASLCGLGRRPLPVGFTATASARQLALAVDPGPLLFALATDDEAPPPGALLALAKAAEWLAREAPARVLVVVPEALAGSAELDAVAFEATHLRGDACESVDSCAGPRAILRASPLIGRPNPSSGGEMRLAERLGRDAELAGLFRFNVRVATARGTTPLVDLVWEEGKVVVEVDGYHFHSDPRAFSNDRRRDYELTVSGYLVLRLPEDEAAQDPALAVEKIRDVVATRRRATHAEKRVR